MNRKWLWIQWLGCGRSAEWVVGLQGCVLAGLQGSNEAIGLWNEACLSCFFDCRQFSVVRWFDHHTVAEGACRDLLRAVQQASRNTSFSMIFSVWYGYDYCTQQSEAANSLCLCPSLSHGHDQKDFVRKEWHRCDFFVVQAVYCVL